MTLSETLKYHGEFSDKWRAVYACDLCHEAITRDLSFAELLTLTDSGALNPPPIPHECNAKTIAPARFRFYHLID